MDHFDYYSQAWIVYILLGIGFLFLLDVSLKKRHFSLRAAILSLIAVLAFTPEKVAETHSLAPMLLTSLFNAETQGVNAIIEAAITLLILWGILLSITLAIHHFINARKQASEDK